MPSVSRSRGAFGSLPRLNFGLATGKYSSSRNGSHTSGGHGPTPKRIATSISSAAKSASAVVAVTLTSTPGFASMKRINRGMSQRAAHPLGEAATGRGEGHALAMSREKRRAEMLLEGADLVAHGAVGQVQLA